MSRRHPERLATNENGKRNTRPVIWTRHHVLSELEDMLAQVRRDKSILYIGELFIDRDFGRTRYAEWGRKWSDDYQISCTMGKIRELLECRIVRGALTGKYRVGPAKFHLINNFNWRSTRR